MANLERDPTMPIEQTRPVRYMHSPTGMVFGSSGDSAAHRKLLIGDPGGPGKIVISELKKAGIRRKVEHDTVSYKRVPTEIKEVNNPIKGYTRMTDDEIYKHGELRPFLNST